jgi:exonuclease SbcC
LRADKAAEQAARDAQPQLDAATALDSRIGENHRQVQALADTLATSTAYEKDCRAALGAREQERAAAVAEADRLDGWLKAEAGRRSLADHLDHWLHTIGSHAEAQSRQATAEMARKSAAGQVAAIDGQAKAATVALAKSEAEVSVLSDYLADLDARLSGLDPDALESQREYLASQDLALQGLLDLTEAASALTRRAASLTEREDAARAQQAAATALLTACEQQAPHLSGSLSEARAALALAEAAESGQADLLRQKLIDGEPCPVCGSRDHPLHDGGAALSALVHSHRQRVDDLDGQVRALDRKRAEAAASERAAVDALRHAAADRRDLEAEHDAAVLRWSQTVAGAAVTNLPRSPFDGVDLAGLNAARQACAAALAAVKEQSAGARALQRDRTASAAKRQDAQTVQQAQAATLSALAPRRAEAEAARQAAEKDAARDAAEAARLAAALAGPLGFLVDWQAALAADAEALAQRCRALAAEWVQASTALETARQTAQTLGSQCDSARAVLEGAERAVKRDETLLADARTALDVLIADRARLVDGRPTADVRNALQSACAEARRILDAAQEACSTARSALTGAEERVQACDKRRAELAKALTAAEETRDAHVAGLGLTLSAVRDAMALGHGWVAEEDKRHAALRQTLSSAEVVLEERRRTLVLHEEQGRPVLAADAVAVALTEASTALEQARAQAALVRQRLADDARNRDSARDTRAHIVAQRQRHDLWKGLSDLIGSANGQRFRQFAQGLTLDRLLEHANGHLADRTARYMLERAPGSDLDLQVKDRDMADEVRGVANLSGGERFLVSLALALGLSSMTGRHVISESLFIDEDFGALDAHSLDVAISALETLQASGRKIGVISHVQPMIDRIGVQVRVSRMGGGRSIVETTAA